MKKTLIIAITLMALFSLKNLQAADSKVKVMFVDTLYGAAIGAVIGGVVILNDDDDWQKKLTLGVTIGACTGLAFGIIDGLGLLASVENERKASKPLIALIRNHNGNLIPRVHVDLMSIYF